MYIDILENGLYVPIKIVFESVENGARILQRSTSNEPAKFTDTDKKFVALDTVLQLIIVEVIDKTMSHLIFSNESAKLMWEATDLMINNTDKVKENIYDLFDFEI